jgi:hypothetical protein
VTLEDEGCWRLTVRLPPAQHRELVAAAARSNTSVNELVRMAVADFLHQVAQAEQLLGRLRKMSPADLR